MARRLIPASEHPTAASTVAGWLVEEWAHLYPDWDHRAATAELLDRGPDGGPPRTWLLLDDEGPEAGVLGSVGLALDGELGAPLAGESTPAGVWLVNLFVTPAARGRGHGTALLDHAVTCARDLGIDELLLTTEHSEAHYAAAGWEIIGATALADHRSTIMRRSGVTR